MNIHFSVRCLKFGEQRQPHSLVQLGCLSAVNIYESAKEKKKSDYMRVEALYG